MIDWESKFHALVRAVQDIPDGLSIYPKAVQGQRHGLRSEFVDINRFVDFVRREEEWRKADPDSNKRAYKNIPEVGE